MSENITLDDLITLAENLKKAPIQPIILTKGEIDYLKKRFPDEFKSYFGDSKS